MFFFLKIILNAVIKYSLLKIGFNIKNKKIKNKIMLLKVAKIILKSKIDFGISIGEKKKKSSLKKVIRINDHVSYRSSVESST